MSLIKLIGPVKKPDKIDYDGPTTTQLVNNLRAVSNKIFSITRCSIGISYSATNEDK